jgi:hypothetical protein
MKLTILQLRRIIREALDEQGWVPGRWDPSSGEPVDDEDKEKLGFGGFPSPLDEEDIDQGHEDASKLVQTMNRQGDGVDYDQMGKRKKGR